MTTKQKAKDLIDSMTFNCKECDNAKLSALNLVNEILAIFYDDTQSMWLDEISYWHEVKKEIEAL